MIVIHLRQHIHRVRVKGQIRAIDDSQGVQLVPKCTLPEHELRSVRPVKTVYTVGTAYAILDGHGASPRY